MKKLTLLLFEFLFANQLFHVEAFYRRPSTVRQFLSTKDNVGHEIKGFASRSLSVDCPAIRTRSKTPFLSSKFRTIGRDRTQRDLRGFILGAGAGAAAYSDQENEESEQKKQALLNLKHFRSLLQSQKKESLGTFIKRLEEDGEINEKDEYGNTPLMIVIKERISSNEKTEILKLLIKHGALPQEEELKNAFGLTSVTAMPSESTELSKSWTDIKPNIDVLKIILPYYEQKILHNLIDLAESKITKIKKSLEETLLKEESYEKQLKYFIDSREDWLKRPVLSNKIEEQKARELLDIDKQIESLENSIDLMRYRQETFKTEIELFMRLRRVIQDSLNKKKLLVPEKEEAELK